MRTLIVAGVVGIVGLLCGADRAEGQAFGPGTNFSFNLGISNGYGHGHGHGPAVGYGHAPGFGRDHGHGYGRDFGPGYGRPGCAPGGYGPGHGFGHPGRGPSYYSSQTTIITTVVYCDRCGRHHDRHIGCGGSHPGGYFPPPFPYRR